MDRTNKIAIVNGYGTTKKRRVYSDDYGNEYIVFRQTYMLIKDLWALDIQIIKQ